MSSWFATKNKPTNKLSELPEKLSSSHRNNYQVAEFSGCFFIWAADVIQLWGHVMSHDSYCPRMSQMSYFCFKDGDKARVFLFVIWCPVCKYGRDGITEFPIHHVEEDQMITISWRIKKSPGCLLLSWRGGLCPVRTLHITSLDGMLMSASPLLLQIDPRRTWDGSSHRHLVFCHQKLNPTQNRAERGGRRGLSAPHLARFIVSLAGRDGPLILKLSFNDCRLPV